MISPREVTEMASPLIDLYRQMEDDLLRNIASRFSIADELTGTQEWQMQQLQELGMLNKKNIRTISKYSRQGQDQIEHIIAKAGFKSVLADETLYEMALELGALKMVPSAVYASPIMRELLDATIRNAKTQMNLVNTTALETANKLFVDTVNQVYLEVNTGVYSYDQSVRKAVRKMGAEGIKGAHYISERGKHTYNQIDVAVKRAALTSSSQVAGQMQMARAKEWGSNYVEVTSHMGARPSHARWQGKIYMIEGGTIEYPNLVEATGYGSIGGLKGANCAHDFYPFFPGISDQRFKPYDLKENDKVYEQSQDQRFLEREIRSAKREAIAAEAAGDTETLARAKAKIKDKQSGLRELTADTGRARRSNREQVVGYTKELDRKANEVVREYFRR